MRLHAVTEPMPVPNDSGATIGSNAIGVQCHRHFDDPNPGQRTRKSLCGGQYNRDVNDADGMDIRRVWARYIRSQPVAK